MTCYRKPKPDVFEMMIYTQTRVFVSVDTGCFMVISALAKTVAVTRYSAVGRELLATTYSDLPAREMGLHDGNGWNLEALTGWLKNDLRTCPVCGRAVTNKRRKYDSDKCRQTAYRKRSK